MKVALATVGWLGDIVLRMMWGNIYEGERR